AVRVALTDRQPVAAVGAEIVVEALTDALGAAREYDPKVASVPARHGCRAAVGFLRDLRVVASAGVIGENLGHARVGTAHGQVGVAFEHHEAPLVADGRIAARTAAGGDRVAGSGVHGREPDLGDAGVETGDRVARRLERDRATRPAERHVAARALPAAQLDHASIAVLEVNLEGAGAILSGEVPGRLEPDAVAAQVHGRTGTRAARVMGELHEQPAIAHEYLSPRVVAPEGIAIRVEGDRTCDRGRRIGAVAAGADQH